MTVSEWIAYVDQRVWGPGMLVLLMGTGVFLTLRTREGLIQCVCPRRPEGVREECAVSVSGLLRPEPRP